MSEPGYKRASAASVALEALRTMIITGQLAPGTDLSQVHLAKAIGVSTTPLREALRQLEAEGLVQARRHRRTRVAPLDPPDLDAVYANRVLIETLGIALSVPRLADADLDALWGHMDAMGAATDALVWDAEHAAFHLRLVRGADPVLQQQIAGLMMRADRYRRMSVRASDSEALHAGAVEHEAILKACARGDADDAALLLGRHLTRSALTLLASLAPDFDPAAVRRALQMVIAWSERGDRVRGLAA